MDKPNGFTLIESLLVLLIVSILVLCSLFFHPKSAGMNADILQNRLLQAQSMAFSEKKRVSVSLDEDDISIDGKTWPTGLACEPAEFHYNAKGNISAAATLVCNKDDQTFHFVLQLGSGRIRIETS